MMENRGRVAFLEAAEAVLDLSDQLTDEVMDRPGLGDWDVRGLAGHLLRAIRTPVDYLAAGAPDGDPIPGAAAYFARYLDGRASNPDLPAAIATRGAEVLAGVDAATAQAMFRTSVSTATDVLEATAPDVPTRTAHGAMHLDDYLRTRSFEVVVHGLDLARALDVEWHPPNASVRDALDLLVEVGVDRGVGGSLLLALTGRDGIALPAIVA